MKKILVCISIITTMICGTGISTLAVTDADTSKVKSESNQSKIPITEMVNERVEEVKEVIVNTNNIGEILNKYNTYEYEDSDGNKVILNAIEVLSIEVANQREDYWETLESITKNITVSYDEAVNIGEKFIKINENGKDYELTNAQFTPIEFNENKPTKYEATLTYTTVIPHQNREINSYKAVIKYQGNIQKEKVVGYEEVKEAESSLVPIVVGGTVGTGTFIVILWLFLNNVVLESNSKRVRSYRKNYKKLDFDMTKEFELYDNLSLVIKKRLAKKLDNTLLIIRVDGKEIERSILNAKDDEIVVKIK